MARDRTPEAMARDFMDAFDHSDDCLELAIARLIRRIREQDARLCLQKLPVRLTGLVVFRPPPSAAACAAACADAIRAQNRRTPRRVS